MKERFYSAFPPVLLLVQPTLLVIRPAGARCTHIDEKYPGQAVIDVITCLGCLGMGASRVADLIVCM